MSSNNKRRHFRLAIDVAADSVSEKLDRLQHYPGIIAATANGSDIAVTYTLGECSYVVVKRYLAELQLSPVVIGSNGFKDTWITFCENNELANMALPAGWPQHLQNLYLSLDSIDRGLSQ